MIALFISLIVLGVLLYVAAGVGVVALCQRGGLLDLQDGDPVDLAAQALVMVVFWPVVAVFGSVAYAAIRTRRLVLSVAGRETSE